MKKKWPERHFIDLFAGAGFARIRGTGEVVAGSPVIAANVPDAFSALHLCEQDDARFEALAHRVNADTAKTKVNHVRGDANAVVAQIVCGIPSRALCITFADPFGLHLDWETISAIAKLKTDLIVLFADNMDALRNWAAYYDKNPDSNLDRFMGEPGWRNLLESTPRENQADRLRARYLERLKSVGFVFSDTERVANDQDHDIYSLVYVSGNERGLDFWNKARRIEESGQRKLFGE